MRADGVTLLVVAGLSLVVAGLLLFAGVVEHIPWPAAGTVAAFYIGIAATCVYLARK